MKTELVDGAVVDVVTTERKWSYRGGRVHKYDQEGFYVVDITDGRRLIVHEEELRKSEDQEAPWPLPTSGCPCGCGAAEKTHCLTNSSWVKDTQRNLLIATRDGLYYENKQLISDVFDGLLMLGLVQRKEVQGLDVQRRGSQVCVSGVYKLTDEGHAALKEPDNA